MANNSTNRAQLRKTLLSHGYKPLPLIDKGIRIKGWVSADITSDWLDQYARNGKFLNTGLRCDDLIAFDIDVLDDALADGCEALIEQQCGPTELCRVGRWPKRLLLYRLTGDKPPHSARTGRYTHGGDTHQVELLCTSGRQFAAFGVHPGTGQDYAWLDGQSPLTVAYRDLPAVTFEQAQRALEGLDTLFVESGGNPVLASSTYSVNGAVAHDLLDGLAVEVDGAETTWGELKVSLDENGCFGNLKRENGEFGDSGAVHFYRTGTSNALCAYDFARDCLHYEPVVADALPDALTDLPDAVTLFDPPELAELLTRWVLIADKTVRNVDNPTCVLTYDGFKLTRSHLTIAAPTAKNPMATQPAVDVWLKDPRTLRADRAQLRPDCRGEVIINESGITAFNTYTPPVFDGGGEVDTALDFIEHLVPDETQRTLFIDWHALKVANPDWRMHSLILVTPMFGTGRGTWMQILQALMGEEYVTEVTLSQLAGRGGQAEYNDFLADSLIVGVPEALEEKPDQTRWQARHLAYEQIKTICDPATQRMHIKRKYGRNGPDRVFASFVISTNHQDAFAMEAGDRRFVVLENTTTPLVKADGGLYQRIHTWKKDLRNIGALHRYLRARADSVTYDPFGDPPMTAAKQRMVEESQSDIDRLFTLFVEEADGDLCTPHQWRSFALNARMKYDLDLPIGSKFDHAVAGVLKKHGRRVNALGTRGLSINNTMCRVWILRNSERWSSESDRDIVRLEVLKNGDAGGMVAQLPSS